MSQQHDIARAWNEAILQAIRNDFARPTVHARNLFHSSIAMYDAWAIYDQKAETYLLGKQLGAFSSEIDTTQISQTNDPVKQQETAAYAVYRLASARFANSPGAVESQAYFDSLMSHFGFDINNNSLAYEDGSAAALGNYLATEIIRYGLQDGSNEQIGYSNTYYEPVNEPLIVMQPGNPTLTDPNRWQPLAFEQFIDQSGNIIPGSIPDFLSPEWGNVRGFTIETADAMVNSRDEGDYLVYHDPGPPPYLSDDNETERSQYQWGFGLVAHWSSHLDPKDGVLWDISPASIGNINAFPATTAEYPDFYQEEGGDWGEGHSVNPKTNQPYQPQIVPRGDYARVLAEFWADGPDSETPPGHWFTILNYVMDHPQFERKFKGVTEIEDLFEYEVKAYFTLGAAMHDVAITAWALKGWYDYIRPISALRYMTDLGQSSDNTQLNYHYKGIPLTDGLIETVGEDDILAGDDGQNVGKIKAFVWKGPDFIEDEETDVAGVGWILLEDWWPYQRPTFVTPPFAGFVSGHSTYSRAAAEVLTLLTGDPYFPGGLGEFEAKQNEFLVFENGPSVDVVLQWATYRDASDQCSLSRIWGGIHPPADDIPGRIIGEQIGIEVFEKAEQYFNGILPLAHSISEKHTKVYPNPVSANSQLTVILERTPINIQIRDLAGNVLRSVRTNKRSLTIELDGLLAGAYLLTSNDQLLGKFVIR